MAAMLAIALPAQHRSLAADLGTVGLLWMPEGPAPSMPTAMVVALHDSTGIDPRGWHYADQLTAAGIAVLHIELLDSSADGSRAAVAADDATAVGTRMAMVMGILAGDPLFASVPVGLLALGSAGQVALLAAADPAHGDRITGVALLYPGCASLATAMAEHTPPRSPVLLLHGDADPANVLADCIGLADRLARSAPVQRRQYAGVGYAWDLAPHGPHETVKLPWPGRPGALVAVTHRPEVAELAGAQVAAFFAARVAAHRR
ncbi:dienelactone hydrolase family protein [Falsiroseomonas sp. E2-1-a4]|uniref:dienelactone hydrolase family protein n=1 Tax=Falsiroseomonas sp. E2-1-a4 TaxID=3239299 RepID=UPI003F29FA81